MELVVDANILLSSFLKEAVTRELLLDSRLTLFAPEYLIFETSRHIQRSADLRKRIRLTNDGLQELFIILTRNIQIIPYRSYKTHWTEALLLAPHKEDVPYLALAVLLSVPIWSNDKGFKKQSRVTIYSTFELVKLLGKRP